MVAFEMGIAQVVSFDGLLIGVNTETIQGFQAEQKAGRWAIGKIKETPERSNLEDSSPRTSF